MSAYGLDNSPAAVTVTLNGAEPPQATIAIGFRIRTEGLYAMRRGSPVVFVLDRAAADTLLADIVQGAE